MAEARTVQVNRAPVLTLWAAVVAERLGFEEDEALTLGQALAGITAHDKAVRIGLYEPEPKSLREKKQTEKKDTVLHVALMTRAIPVVVTSAGWRAINRERPVDPDRVRRYLDQRFGAALAPVRRAMERLAATMKPEQLNARAFGLYMKFRPAVPEGKAGWGAKGVLDIAAIEKLAK